MAGVCHQRRSSATFIMKVPLRLTRLCALLFLLAAAHMWRLLAQCLNASLNHQWTMGLPGCLHWMGACLAVHLLGSSLGDIAFMYSAAGYVCVCTGLFCSRSPRLEQQRTHCLISILPLVLCVCELVYFDPACFVALCCCLVWNVLRLGLSIAMW
jgi:hypothetical protein